MTTDLFTDGPFADHPLVVAARGLAPLAADRAADSERGRRLSKELVEEIRAAGFARHFVPARWGGDEGGFGPFVAAVAEAAVGDPSAAWCASIAATLARMAAYLPEAGRRAVWSQGPDTLVAGALMPAGTAVARPGGWLLEGSWPYLSGIHGADFALLCSPVPMPDGERQVRFLLVPRDAYSVEETWFTMGMRGTGSDTVVLEPCFVPVEHTFRRDELVAGRPGAAACYAAPLRGVSGLSFAAPMLGGAEAMLRAWSAAAARKRSVPRDADRMAQDSGVAADLDLARGSAETDAARLLVLRAAAVADAGQAVSPPLAARAQRDCAAAADLLTAAVNRLLRSAGTGAQSESSALQRYWRDTNAAAGHAVLQWEPAARGFAAAVYAQLSEP